ncbi:hypothetical protein N7532_003335 [Penicillium argentinense]|uniref:NAD-dependent protein deacetylase n=1 Tax=Penicillium argentinense TaxID=1131581 RepID=A0A9W9FM96_9EURO|nr:uncharacterized protein N7532_003335 [Penicillium argentinense]KAJ5102806.1 hypothetical protein N7532_003335 [Penicillium argentinense]
MGNEESSVTDSGPPVLESRSIEAVAKYIKENDVNRVVLMVGAGISTSAGIPDFRSPDTGLYANLAFLDLEEPEDVFDIGFFRQNPKPFYALAHELYPGRYRPTIAHSFIKLLYDKGMLLKHFTQNIDCLERQAGVPGEKIIEAHGSFASQRCIECKKPYPNDLMKQMVGTRKVPCCDCGGYVKPDIVFFGEALPRSFFDSMPQVAEADLCIVMGTSLMVQPFASLPQHVGRRVPRVLINMQKVGGFGSRADDVMLLGECDAGVRKFAKAMGWGDELEALWEATNPEPTTRAEENAPQDWDDRLRDEVDRLTQEVDRSLHLTDAYQQRVRERLGEPSSDNKDKPETSDEQDSVVTGLGHVFPHLARSLEQTAANSNETR